MYYTDKYLFNQIKDLSHDWVLLKNAIDNIYKLHNQKDYSETTNKTYCVECQYEYPCITLKMLDGLV